MKNQLALRIAVLMAIMLHPLHNFAQTATDSNRFKLTAVNLDFGGNVAFTPLTNSDYLLFRSSAEDQSQFIPNPEDYTLQLFTGGGGSFAPNISIGLSPFNKKKGTYNHNQELRLKLGGGYGIRRSFAYSQEDRTPYDTLTSSVGNADTYVDSVFFGNPSYSETLFEINIGATYLFKTNTEKRWHFYTGFGAEYGFALQSFASIIQSEGYYFESSENSPNENDYYGFSGDYDFESYRSKLTTNSHFLRFYVPLGINFRIANKNEFWRHFNLYAQGSGGIELQFVSNGGDTYVNAFGAFAFLGVRYTID